VKIINFSKQKTICKNAALADTAISRMVGLLGRKTIAPDEGLIITHCRSIHMFFMKFAIDVIFTDKNNKVLGLVKNIKPFCMSPYFFKARNAIELFPGTIEKTTTAIGDKIIFED